MILQDETFIISITLKDMVFRFVRFNEVQTFKSYNHYCFILTHLHVQVVKSMTKEVVSLFFHRFKSTRRLNITQCVNSRDWKIEC